MNSRFSTSGTRRAHAASLNRFPPFSLALRFAASVAIAALLVSACSGASSTGVLGCSCTPTEDPVCGSDGVSYANPCNANCAGTPIARTGQCPADHGVCGCAALNAPVCGANGVTYENACSANCAHQSINHSGSGASQPPDASTSIEAGTSDGDVFPGACDVGVCGAGQVCVQGACPNDCYDADSTKLCKSS